MADRAAVPAWLSRTRALISSGVSVSAPSNRVNRS
jgi:hypothetical protein